MQDLVSIPFHSDYLLATETEKDVLVAIRPICQSLGVNHRGQFQRIQRDPVLSEVATTIQTMTDGGLQETLCLPLDYVSGWLFGISPNRVRPEVRDKVLAYQRECHRVLSEHFFGRSPNLKGVGSYMDPRAAVAFLPSRELRVLSAVRYFCETLPDSRAPSVDAVARHAGVSRETAYRAMCLFAAIGAIEPHEQAGYELTEIAR